MNQQTKVILVIFILLISAVACKNEEKNISPDTPDYSHLPSCDKFMNEVPDKSSESDYGAHFKQWLNDHQYMDILISRGGGGAVNSGCIAAKDPVIVNGYSTLNYLRDEKGYQDCELFWILPRYNTTYDHKADMTYRSRRFIQAVREYTNKTKVDIIAGSNGVTLFRKAIQGGVAYQDPRQSEESVCYLGESLVNQIDTFVGIAGVNRGSLLCGYWPNEATINHNSCQENGMAINNPFYKDLNGGPNLGMKPKRVAGYIFSIYSDLDCVAGGSGSTCNIIDGENSAHIPLEDGFYVKNTDLGDMPHATISSTTYAVQCNMIQNHIISE